KNSKRKNVNEIEEEDNKEVLESSKKAKAREHMDQLQKLQEKDPEFYEFLKEHDKEFLQFNDEDIDVSTSDTFADRLYIWCRKMMDLMWKMQKCKKMTAMRMRMEHLGLSVNMDGKSSKKVITTAMVDSWITSIHENTSLGAVRSIMRAFGTACHHGDDGEDESAVKFSIISSSVFNKIMLFFLGEMDGILRGLLKLPPNGGKKETTDELMTTKQWNRHNQLVKSYLGNALHVLNQMTDTEMILFTLRRLRYSCVILHFWGSGGGAPPVVSFLFLRDLCIRIGSDCLDICFKGIYKNYVMNCHFVNATNLEHIRFLGNCVIELLGVDLPTAYQHAFVFIRQLAMILREALNTKTKCDCEALLDQPTLIGSAEKPRRSQDRVYHPNILLHYAKGHNKEMNPWLDPGSSVFKKGVYKSDEEAEDGDDDDEAAAVFSTSNKTLKVTTKKREKETDRREVVAADDDAVEDLVLSSEEDEDEAISMMWRSQNLQSRSNTSSKNLQGYSTKSQNQQRMQHQ
ncbi:Nucleolar complex protein 2, partial [Dillenia turbinata]